jgi:hypothetical protein
MVLLVHHVFLNKRLMFALSIEKSDGHAPTDFSMGANDR